MSVVNRDRGRNSKASRLGQAYRKGRRHDIIAPRARLGAHSLRGSGRDLPFGSGEPQEEQQDIDVDAAAVLQRDTRIGDARLAIEAEREPPERRTSFRFRFSHVAHFPADDSTAAKRLAP